MIYLFLSLSLSRLIEIFTSSIASSSSSLTTEIFFFDELILEANFFPRALADARGWSKWIPIIFSLNLFHIPVDGWRGFMDEDRPRLASLFPFFRSPLFADGGRASSEIETRIDKTMMEIIYHQIQLDDVYPETKNRSNYVI